MSIKPKNAGSTFKVDLDKDLMNIKGSPVHLGKTLMNLLANAAEAIEGGGEISIRTQSCYLDRPIRGDTFLLTESPHCRWQQEGTRVRRRLAQAGCPP